MLSVAPGEAMRGLFRMTAWLVVLQLGHVTVAWACKCGETDANEAVASGDPLVVATIADVGGRTWGCGSPTQTVVRIEVTERLSGNAELGVAEVRTNRGAGSCALPVTTGERWVLQIRDGTVSSCSASRRIQGDDDPWLAELRGAAAAP